MNKQNPRHEPYQHLSEVISHLVNKQNVYTFAKDIFENGLNPMEIIGVYVGINGEMVVAEGNRRVWSILLLAAPSAVPI